VKVSTRGDYASRALLSLALHADESGPTSVRDIAERTGLPQPYLEQILLALKGAGIVRSKRGVGGGYILAREPSQITLGEIVSAVDGPIAVGDFGEPHKDGACWPCGRASAAGSEPSSTASRSPTSQRCRAASRSGPSPPSRRCERYREGWFEALLRVWKGSEPRAQPSSPLDSGS